MTKATLIYNARLLDETMDCPGAVLVEDGKLTEELYQVIDEIQAKYSILKPYAFEKNEGLGCALKKGLMLCENELVARMDTDDIAKSNRFELQYQYIHSLYLSSYGNN